MANYTNIETLTATLESLNKKLEKGNFDSNGLISELENMVGKVESVKNEATEAVESGNEDWLSIFSLLLNGVELCIKLSMAALNRIEKLEKGTEVPELRRQIEKLDELAADLKREHKCRCDLEKRVAQLEEERKREKGIVQVGQLPFEIEKIIIKKVLEQHTQKKRYRQIHYLHEMERALEGSDAFSHLFHSSTDREAAAKAWEKLQQELKWTDEIEDDIHEVKELRLPLVHPTLDINFAEYTVENGRVKEIENIKARCQKLVSLYKALQ